MKKRNGKKGFTLVELLVVIAVLGIMAGIGLNSMSGITDIFRRRADDKTLDQVARTMQIRLMADDHKLLPSSPSSELVYTTAIVPEMNLISQTTGELMIAKATGYKIFGNQNIAQDELNTNDLELYVTFYSDSADGKKHYRRSATISATYIIWDGKGSGEGSGSDSGSGSGDDNSGNDSGNDNDNSGDDNSGNGSGDDNSGNENGSGSGSGNGSGNGGVNHNAYFEDGNNVSYDGSENTDHYVSHHFNVPLNKIDEDTNGLTLHYLSRFVFDPNAAGSNQDSMDERFESVDPNKMMQSNLQAKNLMDKIYDEVNKGTIDSYVRNSLGDYDGDDFSYVLQGSDINKIQGLDPNNDLVSPVTNTPYDIISIRSYTHNNAKYYNVHVWSKRNEDGYRTVQGFDYNTKKDQISWRWDITKG